MREIFEVSVALHGDEAKETEVVVDSTVQEKNITFPTDAKLLTKIVTRCHTMARLEDVKLRRRYQREIKSLLRKSKGRRQGESQRAVRRLRTIAGILVRELKRKLSPELLVIHQQALELYERVQRQQRSDTGKIYSLHEPGVSCISKGKAHKRCEFGAKAFVTVTKTSGIIVGALSFQDNPFDGHTLPAVLSQVESIVGLRPTMAICDRGYRGKRKIGVTSIEIPESGGRRPHLTSGKPGCDSVAVRPRADHRPPQERPQDAAQLPQRPGRRLRESVHGLYCVQFPEVYPDSVFLCLKFLGHILRPNVQSVQACA